MARLLHINTLPHHIREVPAVLGQILNRRQLSLLHVEVREQRGSGGEELATKGVVLFLDRSSALGLELPEVVK